MNCYTYGIRGIDTRGDINTLLMSIRKKSNFLLNSVYALNTLLSSANYENSQKAH